MLFNIKRAIIASNQCCVTNILTIKLGRVSTNNTGSVALSLEEWKCIEKALTKYDLRRVSKAFIEHLDIDCTLSRIQTLNWICCGSSEESKRDCQVVWISYKWSHKAIVCYKTVAWTITGQRTKATLSFDAINLSFRSNRK